LFVLKGSAQYCLKLGISEQDLLDLRPTKIPYGGAPRPPPLTHTRTRLSASLLSLHTEQFLDLLSTAQTRRLEEQRAELPPPRPRAKRHFSLPTSRNLSLPTDDKGLPHNYRCSPPLPQSAADLFEILFRVQGNRLDEQRVEMPPPLGGAC
uniref:Uncharacterized protein n=1 Tax=Xenopus tropicalis TaxID=8364 RepID=A0A6I8RR67_XENTR